MEQVIYFEKFKDHYVSSSYTQFVARDKNK